LYLTVHSLPDIDVLLPSDICYAGGNVAIQVDPQGGTISGTGVEFDQFNPKDGGLVVDQTSYVYYDYTDANNCSNRDSTAVTVRMEPVVIPLFEDTSICMGDDVTLSASADLQANVEWLYNTAVIANSNTVTVEDAGTYSVRAQTQYCSSVEHEVTVNVLNPTVEVTTSEPRIKEDAVFEISVLNPRSSLSYHWTNGTTGETSTGENWMTSVSEDAILSVVAKEQHCTASDDIEITVLPQLKIPRAFTPNGDGVQDTWEIDGLDVYTVSSLRIYNRWGNLVFKHLGVYDEPWNGTFGGAEAPVGTYYYIIEVLSGEEQYQGSVMLIR
jgi:gliding motility-associated-like protein